MKRTVLASVACVLIGGYLVAPGLAQPVPVGSELQVNTYTLSGQYSSVSTMDGDGDFVVVWSSLGQDGSLTGVFARRFASSGAAVATEFQVNSHTTGHQSYPSAAMDDEGDFVVAWRTVDEVAGIQGIFARRFSSAGAALASEFQLNTHTFGSHPSVATDSDGDFVVAWSDYGQGGAGSGILAQRFDSTGLAQGGEFQVSGYTLSGQGFPAAAMDSDGDFVVAYESLYQDGSFEGIFARRFDASGGAQASEFQVNTYTSLTQLSPSAAMDSDGDFVIVWHSLYQDGGNGTGIFARRFDASGSAQAVEFQVNTYTEGRQAYASVDFDGNGDFVVAWSSSSYFGQDSGEIYARRFDAAGTAQAIEFQVNSYTTNPQYAPSVALESNGDFVVSWQSGGAGYVQGRDGDDGGVFAQRFGGAAGPTVVSIDIKPGVFPNSINLRSNAVVRVAILTTSIADGDASDFDAFDVDPFTVGFGPSGAPFLKQQAQDVDFDGDIDQVLTFRGSDAGIPCGATQATLTGMTFTAEEIEGTDSVHTFGC